MIKYIKIILKRQKVKINNWSNKCFQVHALVITSQVLDFDTVEYYVIKNLKLNFTAIIKLYYDRWTGFVSW